MRTHLCGEVTAELAGQAVFLCGWVDRRRDLGGLIFLGLRDRAGIVQVVIEPDSDAFADAEKLRNEFCVRIEGEVRMRPESQWNENMATGRIEVVATNVELLNASAPLPLLMTDEDGEEIRLKYRYLDLRRQRMQRNMRIRSELNHSIRGTLRELGFTEFETPILTKATPEGARDYLVPSRVHPGEFYALPQSPQLFKQLLMMSGMDRYYQIARCFRDEDLRADRQPEFTQLDMEMSFVDEQGVQDTAEALVRAAFADVLNVELPAEFPRLAWRDAMERYGSDKPDLRLPLQLVSVDEHVKHVDFRVFSGPASDDSQRVAALRVPGGAQFSRKQIDEYTDYVSRYGAKGLAWIKVNDADTGLEGLQSPIAKFLDDAAWSGIAAATGVQTGDILFFGAGDWGVTSTFMGQLLVKTGRDLDLAEGDWAPLWVTDFPMFEWDGDEQRYFAMHHPFTAPNDADPAALKADPAASLSRGYDLVLNGNEIGGGSIRIHRQDMQAAVFELLGIGEDEAQEKFGFLLEALKYGCPPHGGIAFGLDRIAALMAGEPSIRDVIAFPKTTTAQCVLTDAPSAVPATLVDELGLALKPKA
ncbi:aspartate--tRNA ligase [Marinihelvus fidelis]|uniref:Aspartate--tRNA ligase n=1 Tax=Marinihelvus fidelis TaxID=2613842 RepID=A0A5N0TEN3_9GAMM|nr:aspartate--tRNA ligase [Marinihelvus fidelis]KAA9133505.1 aspartate--tRNA ligase [Marinihelvus fidelis]